MGDRGRLDHILVSGEHFSGSVHLTTAVDEIPRVCTRKARRKTQMYGGSEGPSVPGLDWLEPH